MLSKVLLDRVSWDEDGVTRAAIERIADNIIPSLKALIEHEAARLALSFDDEAGGLEFNAAQRLLVSELTDYLAPGEIDDSDAYLPLELFTPVAVRKYLLPGALVPLKS